MASNLITALQAQVKLDVSDFDKKQGDMRRSLSRVRSIFREMETPLDKYKKDLKALYLAQKEQKLSAEEVAKAEKFLAEKYSQSGKEAKNYTGSIKTLAAAYASFATVKAGVRIAADIEQAKIAFEVMAGSAEKGRQILGQVRDFAASTPITFEAAQKSAKTLMQFGVESDKVASTLRMLGDIAAGDSNRLEGLALAFGQVAAAGRLTGQETLQMVNQGFNPLKQMAEDMAKQFGGLADDYFPNLKLQMEQGQIDFEVFALSIEAATSAGGRFAGMSDRMGETFSGATNQMYGAMQAFADAMGEGLLPRMAEFVHSITKIIEFGTQMVRVLDQTDVKIMLVAGAALAGMKAGARYADTLQDIVKWIGALRKAEAARMLMSKDIIGSIKSLTKAVYSYIRSMITALSLSGPKGWAMLGGAVLAAGAAYVALSEYMDDTTKDLKNQKDALEKTTSSWDEYQKKLAEINERKNEIRKEKRSELEDIEKQLDLEKRRLLLTDREIAMSDIYKTQVIMADRDRVARLYDEVQALKEKAAIQKMLDDRVISAAQTESQFRDLQNKGLITNVQLQEKLFALEDKRLEKVKQLADAGKSIQEKYNPVAKVAEQLAQLNVLLATGNITQEQFLKERNDMLKKSLSIGEMGPVEAQKRGSQELASFLAGEQADVQQRQLEEAMAQKLLQEAQLQAQQETNRKLSELQPVGVIRK